MGLAASPTANPGGRVARRIMKRQLDLRAGRVLVALGTLGLGGTYGASPAVSAQARAGGATGGTTAGAAALARPAAASAAGRLEASDAPPDPRGAVVFTDSIGEAASAVRPDRPLVVRPVLSATETDAEPPRRSERLRQRRRFAGHADRSDRRPRGAAWGSLADGRARPHRGPRPVSPRLQAAGSRHLQPAGPRRRSRQRSPSPGGRSVRSTSTGGPSPRGMAAAGRWRAAGR